MEMFGNVWKKSDFPPCVELRNYGVTETQKKNV